MTLKIRKQKKQKKCVIKRILKFNDYKNCLPNNEVTLKSQKWLKKKKIALDSNDDKRLQTFDRVTLYPYDTNAGKMCKRELLKYLNIKWLFLTALITKIKQNIIQSGHIF